MVEKINKKMMNILFQPPKRPYTWVFFGEDRLVYKTMNIDGTITVTYPEDEDE